MTGALNSIKHSQTDTVYKAKKPLRYVPERLLCFVMTAICYSKTISLA
ncbi:hypothetical protein FAES_1294 [Fibrella aestuarina BUZ 2]|uniref:Transposase n=1 Tax=Fibrella aestuarina BUZ 2 TaxID=1166018 RepID=I0K5A1_9BACT|nr:hypothetical protein FAES_1294 [Fibrella aestuarina BUZ 2]